MADDGAQGNAILPDVLVKFEDDKTVKVDGLEAAVLMRASPVFLKMLTHDMQEKLRGEIELPGKDAAEFEVLMKFLLPGSARLQSLSDDTVGFLWKWSEEYMIESLKDECVQFIRTAKASKKILIAAQELNMETRVRECVDELLVLGERDWKECYGDHAVMQAIVESTMNLLNSMRKVKHVHPGGTLDFGDQLRCKKCDRSCTAGWQCETCRYKK